MVETISNTRKSRGRPKVGATQISVRLPPEQLAQLDAWIADQPKPISRPEALREMMRVMLSAVGRTRELCPPEK